MGKVSCVLPPPGLIRTATESHKRATGAIAYVPRTQRSAPLFAISAFTRVFAALWRCAAEPGSYRAPVFVTVPALRSGMKNAASRQGNGRWCVIGNVGWAKARSAVPTIAGEVLMMVGTAQ